MAVVVTPLRWMPLGSAVRTCGSQEIQAPMVGCPGRGLIGDDDGGAGKVSGKTEDNRGKLSRGAHMDDEAPPGRQLPS